MKVGIVYDLRDDYRALGYDEETISEFDKKEVIDSIAAAINELGHQIDRIGNVHALLGRLHNHDRWDLVFNIAEGLHGIARESQVPMLLDLYEIPYTFSDPTVLALCMHKGFTKTIVRAAGIKTADFIVCNDIGDLERLDIAFPAFAKPVAEGTSKGISGRSRITSRDELLSVGQYLLDRFRQAVLIERFLPGKEYTVGIIGTGRESTVAGAMEVIINNSPDGAIYSLNNKLNYESFVSYEPVSGLLFEKLCALSLSAWNVLGCRDAGRVDFKLDEEGTPNFIEVNPLAGLNEQHSDLPIICRMSGIRYATLIGGIIASAQKRISAKAA